MKLKKRFITITLALAMTTAAFASEVKPSLRNSNPIETPSAVRAQEMLTRLETIKAMDVNTLTKAEKKSLRREVKSIKKEMKTTNTSNGVYISIGAAIIIVLLLILIF